MSEEVFNEIKAELNKLEAKISALPNSSGNGQLIDALSHARCVEEHLRRYFMLTQQKGVDLKV
ncbi:MAG: hypothetical protein K2N23_06130 [Clostridia bacterium]|nr:hypothetical protein [Clostridia bacterium]